MRNKQNCYYDVFAVAEDLVETKRALPQTLALTGGSNGGLMAGVALTQRPDTMEGCRSSRTCVGSHWRLSGTLRENERNNGVCRH